MLGIGLGVVMEKYYKFDGRASPAMNWYLWRIA